MTERYPTPATPDRVAFDLLVDGSSVGIDVIRDVIEIDVDERVNRQAITQILLHNWNPSSRTVRYSDDGPFAPGTELEVRIGYHSELRTVFSGVVTGLTVSFSNRSIPVLIVDGRDKSIRLTAGRRSRSYEDVTDTDIITAIADDHGLTASVGEGIAYETLIEPELTDWERVVSRAQRYGWVTYTRGDELVARPPAAPQDPIALAYGRNLLELRVGEDLRGLHDPSRAARWDPENLESVVAETTADSTEVERGDRAAVADALDAFGGPLHDQHCGAATTGDQAAADLHGSGAARLQALRHITGRGAAIGVPDLRIDSWLDIDGGGDRFRGPHYVSEVRHRVGRNGYTTEFALGVPRPLVPTAAERSAPSMTLGIVDSLDDPKGWGRVSVRAPWLGDDLGAVWARLATLDAGSEFGTLFVPEVGQEVVVGHVGENADEPVVLGCLWNGQAAPPEAIDADANDVRSIVTKTGHHLRFDDGAKTVELRSAGGHSVLLDDDDGSVVLTDSGGSSITIDTAGIALHAAQGDITLTADAGNVTISAVAIEGSATAPSKLESSATLDISASATLGLKGALVNIN